MWIKFTLTILAAIFIIAFFIQAAWIKVSIMILTYIVAISALVKESIHHAYTERQDHE